MVRRCPFVIFGLLVRNRPVTRRPHMSNQPWDGQEEAIEMGQFGDWANERLAALGLSNSFAIMSTHRPHDQAELWCLHRCKIIATEPGPHWIAVPNLVRRLEKNLRDLLSCPAYSGN